MKHLTVVLLFAAASLVPATASAVTIQEVVSLSKSGVADEVIVALIDRDRGVFPIDAAQLEERKTAGVSETVMLAMLKSGLPLPQPPSAPSLMAEVPQVVIVGHGPDVPNSSTDVYVMPVRFVVPYVVGSVAGHGACAGTVETRSTAAVPVSPFGRFMNDPMGRFTNNGFIAADNAVAVPDCQPAAPAPPRTTIPRRRR